MRSPNPLVASPARSVAQAEIAAFRLQRLQLRGQALDAAKEERREKLGAASVNWVRRSTLDARINQVLDAQATVPPWV